MLYGIISGWVAVLFSLLEFLSLGCIVFAMLFVMRG